MSSDPITPTLVEFILSFGPLLLMFAAFALIVVWCAVGLTRRVGRARAAEHPGANEAS